MQLVLHNNERTVIIAVLLHRSVHAFIVPNPHSQQPAQGTAAEKLSILIDPVTDLDPVPKILRPLPYNKAR